MVITIPASLATLFEVAMAAEGIGFECMSEGSLTSKYIVATPIEQIREIVIESGCRRD